MLEVYLAKAANRLYRGALRLSLGSINLRDNINLKLLDRRIAKAERKHEIANSLVEVAATLHSKADEHLDQSHSKYGQSKRRINVAFNQLENALEDAKL